MLANALGSASLWQVDGKVDRINRNHSDATLTTCYVKDILITQN